MKDMPSYLIHGKAPAQVYDLFYRHGRKEILESGQIFVLAGRKMERISMLIEGNAVFIYIDMKGIGHYGGVLPAGGIAGYAPALSGRASEFSLMCLDPLLLYSVPVELFLETIHADLSTENILLGHLVNSMSSIYRALLLQMSLNLPQRLAMFLQAYASCTGAEPDVNDRIFLPLVLTHEKLGLIISATRVTTTILMRHLHKLDMLKQLKEGLEFPAILIDSAFIGRELSKSRWTKLRA